MKAMITSLLLMLCIGAATDLHAQNDREEDRNRVKSFEDVLDRTYVGGNIGGGLSQYYTYLEISPIAGYMLTDNLSAGLGFTYQYRHNKVLNFSTSIYGPRAFGRFQILDWLFAYSEYEYLFLEFKEDASSTPFKVQAPGFLVGGGISSGGYDSRTGGFVMVLYNLNSHQYTPYDNPVFRFGFTIGL